MSITTVVEYSQSNSTQSEDIYTVRLGTRTVNVHRDYEDTWYANTEGHDISGELDTPEVDEIDEAVARFDQRLRDEYRARGVWELAREADAAALAAEAAEAAAETEPDVYVTDFEVEEGGSVSVDFSDGHVEVVTHETFVGWLREGFKTP